MESQEYLGLVEKYKPHKVSWEERVKVLSAEKEKEIKSKREAMIKERVDNGSDETHAKIMAQMEIGRGFEFQVKEKERDMFTRKENWEKPWEELSQEEKNAFFHLFLNQVGPVHFHGPDDAPEPDYRTLIVSFLEDEDIFFHEMKKQAAM